MLEDLDLHSIADDRARALVTRLLNLLEDVRADLRAAQVENQRLRDEINRLKGEQGTPQSGPTRHSGPARITPRSKNGARPKSGRKAARRSASPSTENRWCRLIRPACRQMRSSKATRTSWCRTSCSAPTMSCSIKRSFTPRRNTGRIWRLCPRATTDNSGRAQELGVVFYYGAQMSEPKVAELLRSVGVQISDGQVSNLLIKDQAAFHAEKDAIYRAGLASSPWQHLDDTSTRVNGQNGSCHIVCNPLYTAYFTTPAKDRLTVIDVLTNQRPRRFLINEEALGYVEVCGLSAVRRRQLGQLPAGTSVDEATMQALLEAHLPGSGRSNGTGT